MAVVPLLMAPGGHLLSDIKAFVDKLNQAEGAGLVDVLTLPSSRRCASLAVGVKAALNV